MKRLCAIATVLALAGCAQKPATVCAADATLSTVSAILAPAAQSTGAEAVKRADVTARVSYSLIVVDEHDPKTGRVKCSATLKVDRSGLEHNVLPTPEEVRVDYTVQPDATGNGQVITVAPSIAPVILLALAADLDQQPEASVPASTLESAPTPDAKSATSATARHAFEEYPASAYVGPSVAPDFAGREAQYADFRTRLRAAFDEGVNFGGGYSIAEIGCGTGCRFVYIINQRNGAISAFPLGGEEYYSLDLNYVPDSNLIQASWEGVDGDARFCFSEDFNWTTREFQSLGRKRSPGSCTDQ